MGDKLSSWYGKLLSVILIAALSFMQLPAGQIFAVEDKATAQVERSGAAPAPQAPPDAKDAQGQAADTADSKAGAKPDAKPEESEQETPAAPGMITVNFKGADVKTVLAYISEVAGVDIVATPDVKGIIDLKLTNKPWKSALDIIVRNYGFAYEMEGDIIRVVTQDKLNQEELVTQAFSLNYSKSKEVVDSLKNMVGDRGKVIYNDRTNTVLVTDIPTNIYRVAQVIAKLDKKTEQVLIEARVIETVLGDDEKLGIDWNVKITAAGASRPMTWPFNAFNNQASKALEKVTPFSQTGTNTTTYDSAGNLVQTAPGDFPASQQGMLPKDFPFAVASAFQFGTLDFTEFKAILELLKQRSDTDTISNPRIATLNNNKATINVGQIIYFPTFERNATTGKMEITGYDQKNSGIILDVTPHINDVGEIALDLAPQISQYLGTSPIAPGSDIYAPQFNTREAKTQVMIKDGQTIFIGGLISERNVDRRTKLPFIGDMLGDVPYLGLLFSKKNIVKERVELIFFITVHLMSDSRAIKDVPLPNKAYIPVYTDTQQGNAAVTNKKRLKKTY